MNLSIYEYLVIIILAIGGICYVKTKRWIYILFTVAALLFISGFIPSATTSRTDGIYSSLIVLLIGLIAYKIQLIKIKKYQEGTYYKQTQVDYYDLHHGDIGRYGEFLVYDELKTLEDQGVRLLFNAYIPKPDGTTSEVDVIIITKCGLFIVESKNYSGWIFGDKHRKMWMQMIGRGIKNQFYNPIWQNHSHCKYLKELLNIDESCLTSYIVFSDRCELKKVPPHTHECKVIHRQHLLHYIKEDMNLRKEIFNDLDIIKMYDLIYPLTKVDEQVKLKHIDNIRNH